MALLWLGVLQVNINSMEIIFQDEQYFDLSLEKNLISQSITHNKKYKVVPTTPQLVNHLNSLIAFKLWSGYHIPNIQASKTRV